MGGVDLTKLTFRFLNPDLRKRLLLSSNSLIDKAIANAAELDNGDDSMINSQYKNNIYWGGTGWRSYANANTIIGGSSRFQSKGELTYANPLNVGSYWTVGCCAISVDESKFCQMICNELLNSIHYHADTRYKYSIRVTRSVVPKNKSITNDDYWLLGTMITCSLK